MKRTIIFSITIVLLTGLVTCVQTPEEPEFNNPSMPGDISYTAPQVNIVDGPQENDVVNSPTVTFQCEGNEVVVDFCYQLDEEGWSDWTSERSVTYSFLDEGSHMFQVRGRNMMGIEDNMNLSRSFQIDAVQGPALWFSPRRQVVNSGDEFTVTLMAEDMYNMMGVYAPVMYNLDALTLVDYFVWDDVGSYLRKNGGEVLALIDQENGTGLIAFNLAVVEGSPPGLDGSGKLATLTFQANSSQMTSVYLGGNARVTDSVLNTTYLSGDKLMPAQVEVR